ncbi:unnamed protein product [Heterobilharzia americana]|nr:unnamed protein product [Heterobilharzia americana]
MLYIECGAFLRSLRFKGTSKLSATESSNSRSRSLEQSRCEKLSAFLERACLRNFYSILKKKLKINDPIDFARFKPTDLTYLGMTGNEINRLVNQLMEDGFPVGSLLSDENADCGHLFTDSEPYPVTGFHRSKLLRKIFRKKQSFYTSAPVSPAHRPEYRSINQFPIHRPQIHVPFRSTSLTDDRKSSLVQNNCESATVNPATCTCLIPEKDIKLYSRIGIGSFGIVRRGDWTMPTGETIPVAVKLLRPEQ